MDENTALENPQAIAAEIDAELCALPVRDTPNERAVRRQYSRLLKQARPAFILDVARALLQEHGQRWYAYELIADHPGAFARIGAAELEALGHGMDSWSAVDSFARTLSGPAWLKARCRTT